MPYSHLTEPFHISSEGEFKGAGSKGGDELGEGPSDDGGIGVEFGPLAALPIGLDPAAVAGVARHDVQMRVEDLLERGLAVGQEQVHAVGS